MLLTPFEKAPALYRLDFLAMMLQPFTPDPHLKSIDCVCHRPCFSVIFLSEKKGRRLRRFAVYGVSYNIK